MNTSTSANQKGFTIIEVVLVLAIAGMIFLLVFLAVPALQRSQRDTQRRDDMSRFMAQLQSYQSNNKGKVPTAVCTSTAATDEIIDFVGNYMTASDQWADPVSGNTYICSAPGAVAAANSATLTTGTFQYVTGARCDGETLVADGNRKAAVRTKLEGSGIACFSN